MNRNKPLSNSLCAEQMQLAELELSAFIAAVTQLFGPVQARLAAQDWLDELEQTDNPLRSTSRDWRIITIAASAQLATRLQLSSPVSASPCLDRIQKSSPKEAA